MKTSASSLYRTLRERLGAWYDREARDLPWRRDVSAYHVLLSEIILQQTRVDQGMSYYHRFTEAFPTVYDLAAASEDEVLLLWQGLGYYSRGRNLRRAAQIIVSDYGGELPRTLEELSRLPGVGPYTCGAILSFAYNLPFPTVDGNVYRVLSRHAVPIALSVPSSSIARATAEGSPRRCPSSRARRASVPAICTTSSCASGRLGRQAAS